VLSGFAAPPRECSAQIEFYRQDPITSPGGYSSQDARNEGGLGWFSEVADNFPGTGGNVITRVVSWGGYVTPVGQEGNIEGITIRFYADSNGAPGKRLFEQDVIDINETLYAVAFGFGEYSYTTDLSPGFTVPADGQYWVSVVSILARGGSANEPQWGWVQTPGVTGPSASQRFFSPVFNPVGVDMAFVLSGTEGGPPPCACDWNVDGFLNSQDFFDFLVGFFANNADFNHDNTTNSQDFFDFLSCFFTGC
jgi:hypothetical protein